MPEDSYAGWQTYLLVLRQADGVCPYNTHTYDSNDVLVQREGIFFVSSAYANPYDSFANLAANRANVASVMINTITGEGRIYDGTHAGADEYFTFEQFAVGKVKDPNPNNERGIIKDFAMGEWDAVDLKAQQHDVSTDFDKTWCPKRKITPDKTNVAINQLGFEGSGIFEKIAETPQAQDWYMIILYTRDAQGTEGAVSGVVAQTKTFPCSKIEKIEIKTETKEISRISFTSHSTYTRTYPDDSGNISDYDMTSTLTP